MFKIPITLTGSHLHLESLQSIHRNALYDAARDERIWTYHGTTAFGDHFDPWFNKALRNLDAQHDLPFAVRRLSDKKIIGSTRFYNIHLKHRRLSIGNTWYTPDVWGSYVNPECKFLLLQYAFETLAMNRVEFSVNARNIRSRAAVKKLGATEEGLLRSHMILNDGSLRDTVVFSIIKSEWPGVKMLLQTRLASS